MLESMDFLCFFWVGFFMVFAVPTRTVVSQRQGFLSIACGGTALSVDSFNISWVPDNSYVRTGNTTTVNFIDGGSSLRVPLRFFPSTGEGRQCYRLPLQNSSMVLIRSHFYYKNYDGLNEPPSFWVSLGTATPTTVNLTISDPWVEEFIWPVDKDALPFCLVAIPGSGFPVISRLEIRSMPMGAYTAGREDLLNRYPLDSYDRIWDADENFSPIHLSAGFNIPLTFNLSGLQENPPINILQSARVLARRDALSYNLPLNKIGDYYVVLYFAGILPVSPMFDILINGEVVQANFTVKNLEASALYFIRKSISSLNITFQNGSFYPLVNAVEVYELIEILLESSTTTVSALQVIQQSTGLDLGWEDDPCSPTPWKHVGCEGSLVTSLELSDINLRSISPTFGDLLDLKSLDLHNNSLTGEIENLASLQQLEILNLSFNGLSSFGSDFETLVSLQVFFDDVLEIPWGGRELDLQNNSLQGNVPDSLGSLQNLHLLDLENNNLQGILPQSLNKQSLEVRTSGNLCLSFSASSCNVISNRPPLQTPQVTVPYMKKDHGHNQKAILGGAIGGALCALLFIGLLIFMYRKNRRGGEEGVSTSGNMTDMHHWNAAKVFSYKEVKIATNNFKDIIGRGSFGSVYLGKLPDVKLVAVKVRSDRTQLGADSFINE
ncbi:hypothetical protein ACLOJK_023030 [Asimina triloba]